MSVWSRRIILIICWSRCINIRAFFGSLHCPRVHNLLARWLQLRIDFLPSPLFPAATTKIELWSMRERGKLPRVSGRIPAVKHFMVLLEIKIFPNHVKNSTTDMARNVHTEYSMHTTSLLSQSCQLYTPNNSAIGLYKMLMFNDIFV